MTTELEHLRRESERLATLLSFMKIFSHELDRDGLLLLVMLEIRKVMMADRSTLFLLDEGAGELWSKAIQGDEVTEIRFPKNLGIAGHVVNTGETLNIADAYQRIFAIKPDEAIGCFYARALNAETNQDFVRAIGGVVATGQKYSGYDLKYLLPGGEESANFNISIVPLRNSKAKPIGQVLVVDDITQEQRMMSPLSRYVDRGVAEESVIYGIDDDAVVASSLS